MQQKHQRLFLIKYYYFETKDVVNITIEGFLVLGFFKRNKKLYSYF